MPDPTAAKDYTKRQARALTDVGDTAHLTANALHSRDKAIRVAVKLGLSLRDVATAAGLGHSTVRRIVNGVK